ncbi:Phospholipase D LspiSicTox-betaIE3i [Folsomia candida]|uniref:Phospholipase D LspiSicTox-betaIE3i n=1 Tax=Folsomia candida TaxID=158441 RepID=A0A226D3P9_FOLCA|nr:Phospholipase D LspiSicTox-betaIE3i [Folsomia candida]
MVRTKFLLPEEAELSLQDEAGEVDEEVLQILLEQATTLNLIFYVKGEDTGATTFEVVIFEQDGNLFKQVLNNFLEENQQLSAVVSDCNKNGFVDSSSSSYLIKEFVEKLRDSAYKGLETSCFSNCGNIAVSGILDLLYDDTNRSGLIEARLRLIHGNLKGKNKELSFRGTGWGHGQQKSRPGSPKFRRFVCCLLYLKLNGLSSKAEVQEIEALMTATLPHRNLLRSTNELSILKAYNKFGECKLPFSSTS